MDNLATLQWEILDRAREDRKAGKFEQAKETLLDLVHEPRTPAWIQASAWQQLALLPNPWATSREYLDKALQVCQQLNGETEREKEVDATFLRDTLRMIERLEVHKPDDLEITSVKDGEHAKPSSKDENFNH